MRRRSSVRWCVRAALLAAPFAVAACGGHAAPDPQPAAPDAGGTGGAGGGAGGSGGSSACTPGAQVPCYSGPAATKGVGLCREGTLTCHADGTGFGACEGEVIPSPELCQTPEDEDCDGVTGPCQGGAEWTAAFAEFGEQYPEAIAVDGQGNAFVLGMFYGTASFGGTILTSAGEADLFLLKLDPAGTPVWSVRVGGTGGDYGIDLALTPDGAPVIAGSFHNTVDFGFGPVASAGLNDAFVLRLDPLGQPEWVRAFGGAGEDLAYAVSAGADGAVHAAGAFELAVDFGAGPLLSAGDSDMFLIRLDADGATTWSRRFGGPYGDFASALAARGPNVLLAGGFYGTVDFGGGPFISPFGTVLAEYDPAGEHVSSTLFDGADAQSFAVPWDVDVDATGNVLVAGYFGGSLDLAGEVLVAEGTTDAFVAKFGPTGVQLWAKRYGGPNVIANNYDPFDIAYSVSADPAGNVWVTGQFLETIELGGAAQPSAGSTDAFFVRLDPSGKELGGGRAGDGSLDAGRSIAALPSGAALLTGYFNGALDLGSGQVTSKGTDVFVAKLLP